MSGSREAILGRIREALKIAAPKRWLHGHGGGLQRLPEAEAFKEWLPPVGDTLEDRIDLFARNSAELKTEFFVLESEQEAISKLREIGGGWEQVGVQPGELTERVAGALGARMVVCQLGYAVDTLEACAAGITLCDALVAQTGSVLITSRTSGGRALSVLPPHHVVLARKSQLVADLSDAYALVRRTYKDHYPSLISMITGPSRTGDIERILVLGAHGPKRLTILVW